MAFLACLVRAKVRNERVADLTVVYCTAPHANSLYPWRTRLKYDPGSVQRTQSEAGNDSMSLAYNSPLSHDSHSETKQIFYRVKYSVLINLKTTCLGE